MTLSPERIRTWRRAVTSVVALLVLYELASRSGYFLAEAVRNGYDDRLRHQYAFGTEHPTPACRMRMPD